MRPEDYLVASRAIHIELEKLANRVLKLAKFRCAEPTNHAFMNAMNRHTELLEKLAELHGQVVSQNPGQFLSNPPEEGCSRPA